MSEAAKKKKGFRAQKKTETKASLKKENDQIKTEVMGALQNLSKIALGNLNSTKRIDAELEAYADILIKHKEVDRAAKEGDALVIGFLGRLLKEDGSVGEPIANGFRENMILHNLVAGKSLVADFEEKIVGMKAGDKKEIKIVFPAEYGELEGKEAQFDVVVLKVLERTANADYITELKNELLKESQAAAVAGEKNEVSEEKAE
jgi:FKBP-type peptidyl-prolyl cis-trans isomerase (trigger factor)